MNRATFVLSAFLLFFCAPFTHAQVKEPPRSEKLDIQIRFRIRAERDERVRQYRLLERYLESLGFQDGRKDEPTRDLEILDPNSERFVGTIPSSKVLDVLNDSRVQNILFAPAGYVAPESSATPVPIRVVLRTGLSPTAEQALHQQALAQLELLGFKEALAYDTRGYTQLKGTIPYKNVNLLVKDLRTEPAGWFFTETPLDQLPHPFADRNPVRWVEVMPAVDAPPGFTPEAVLPARAKITPDLRAKLLDPAAKNAPLLVEVVFAVPMEDRLDSLRTRLINSYGLSAKLNSDGTPLKRPDGTPVFTEGASLEGVIGNVVTIRFDKPADAERYILEPGILSMRLPRRGLDTVFPQLPDQAQTSVAELLKTSGVETLQRLGYKGAGVKVVVIGVDFTGADKLIGNALPKKTSLLDLTAELEPDITPLPADASRSVPSLAVARAVALAVPEAELVLVRIDAGSFFELQTILRVTRGDPFASEAMRSRLFSYSRKSTELTRRKDAALAEYRQAFNDLSDDEPSRARRVKARAALDGILAEQHALTEQLNRYARLQREIPQLLAGARVIVNPLVWESGYPLDALSDLSRTLERVAAPPPPRSIRPATGRSATLKPNTVWVQAASPFATSVWAGPFRDLNHNGIMDFAPAGEPLPAGNWSAELNFLGFQNAAGESSLDLPEGRRIRFTMQWREPINPQLPNLDVPAFPVVLRLLRQLDPNGEKRPSDEMAEEARSAGGPYAIARTSTFAVYEQILEFVVPSAGRYALMIATGYQPDERLPALRRHVEIAPRLFLETLSAKPGDGQATFRSYRNPEAGVGIPSDSPGVVTVGVPVSGSLKGGGIGVSLLVKPDVLGPDALLLGDGTRLRGPGIATGYVAGIATALVQADAAGANVFRSVGVAPGKLPVLPDAWLRYLRPSRQISLR